MASSGTAADARATTPRSRSPAWDGRSALLLAQPLEQVAMHALEVMEPLDRLGDPRGVETALLDQPQRRIERGARDVQRDHERGLLLRDDVAHGRDRRGQAGARLAQRRRAARLP